ncbi:MAG: hypothetical protein HC803_04615 [Saprospiraceae bacterium]|nr:hypothetical protein [Saprospiraceae bacterium]
MKNIFILSVLIYVSIQFFSCDLIDTPEPIPAYIYIDTIKLQTQSGQGTNSHKIKDAWIFVDNQLIGPFELPAKAPVLADGTSSIEVFAGMADNGIVSLPEIYPFYNRYVTTKQFVPGETLEIEPTVTYDDETVFAFIEDFETSNIFGEELDGNVVTKIERTEQGEFEGRYSGKITLDNANPIFEAATVSTYNIFDANNVSSPIYLEINYKNNMPFEIGILGYNNGIYVDKIYSVGFNPKDEWNKVYVNLTLDVSVMDADSYRVVIRAAKGSDIETGEIYLDNIKLLHF